MKLKFAAGSMQYNEDPYVMAGELLYEWKQTDIGQWAFANSLEKMVYTCVPNPNMGFDVYITGDFTKDSAIEYALKFGL